MGGSRPQLMAAVYYCLIRGPLHLGLPWCTTENWNLYAVVEKFKLFYVIYCANTFTYVRSKPIWGLLPVYSPFNPHVMICDLFFFPWNALKYLFLLVKMLLPTISPRCSVLVYQRNSHTPQHKCPHKDL